MSKPDVYASGYEELKSIVNVLKANHPDVWDDMDAESIIGACKACMTAGEFGYATPRRMGAREVAWFQDDPTPIARFRF